MTLPVWMLSATETSRYFVVKGKVVDKDSNQRENNVHVFARVDDSFIKELSFNNYLAVNIDDGQRGDISEKEVVYHPEEATFEFKIGISIDGRALDEGIFDLPQRLRFKYNVRTSYFKKGILFGGSQENTEFDLNQEKVFEFFVCKGLENTRTWMGLDPGTTGSCVSLGVRSGGTISTPNIRMLGDGIIPSCIIIPQTTKPKSQITDYIPGEDYLYGIQARQMWRAEVNKGSRCFVSIKKLLGYSKKKIPVLMSGNEQGFSGVEIAHLLIKGIDSDAQKNIEAFSEVDKEKFFGKMTSKIQRLVVAIPNNYTLPKTLDMVESIKRLGKYSEIRCVYEPEAVLFNYLMKEYHGIEAKDNEVVMVFDMGGATINASLYRLHITKVEDKTKIKVKTIGRVGYAVGGDNIDFALIETLLDVYTRRRSNGPIDEKKRREVECEYKNDLLQKIFPLKLALIEASKGNFTEMFVSEQMLVHYINDIFSPLSDYGYKPLDEDILKIELNINMTGIWDDYRVQLVKNIIQSKFMKEYVFDRIEESVQDLLTFCNKKEDINTLIFSGRSVLFADIKETVLKALNSSKIVVWDKLSNEEIKSAVAKGACWYGMYGSTISLDNELITSSYGFKKVVNGKVTFIPVIESKNTFDEYYGKYSNEVKINSVFDEEGNIVEFYQMLGANTEDVFTKDKRYKLNLLGIEDIDSDTSKICMTVGRNDNVLYEIHFEDGRKLSPGIIHSKSDDILDDNDPAYVFATLQPTQSIQSGETTKQEKQEDTNIIEPNRKGSHDRI